MNRNLMDIKYLIIDVMNTRWKLIITKKEIAL